MINALRSHDELLGEQLEELRYELGKRGTVGKVDKIIIDLPTNISNKFEESLQIKLVESTTESWEFWFAKLELYKEQFGDCLVPALFVTESGFRLGSWVNHMRTSREKLDSYKVEKLESVGFIWDVLNHQWEEAYKELLKYKEIYGDCLVPLSY